MDAKTLRQAAEAPASQTSEQPKPRGRARLVVVILSTVAVTLGAVWLVRTYIYPALFRPVELTASEQRDLDVKLEALGVDSGFTSPAQLDAPLEPEPYTEIAAQRRLVFTEREINALIGHNTNLASRLAIDLSDDLASAKLLLPMQDDFPLVGGRTIRIDAGLEMAFANGRPVFLLRGVSIMGVPVPDAWLGNLRNVDLVEQFGGDRGFWQRLAAGIASLQISDGELVLELKE